MTTCLAPPVVADGPASHKSSPSPEPDAAHNDMMLVVDDDRPAMNFRQQVLLAWEAECRRLGTAAVGHA